MEFLGNGFVLREFTEQDLPDLLALEMAPETYMYEDAMPSEQRAREILDGTLTKAQETPRTLYHMALCVDGSAGLAGRLHLRTTDWSEGQWEVGWALHRTYWGRGFATQAAQLLVNFAFDTLNAHRVVAYCHADNAASIRVMERLGMQREACFRQALWMGNGWADELVYARLSY